MKLIIPLLFLAGATMTLAFPPKNHHTNNTNSNSSHPDTIISFNSGAPYYWIRGEGSNHYGCHLGGFDNMYWEYLCIGRVVHGHGHLVGYVRENWGKIEYSYESESFESGNYEIFYLIFFIVDSLSWIDGATAISYNPEALVSVGDFPETSEPSYICRTLHYQHILIGTLRLSTGLCDFSWYFQGLTTSNYEVLALNMFGKYIS